MASYDDIPDGPQAIPGQVIIKLTQTAQREMTAAVPTGPMRGMTEGAPSGLGVSSIDKVLKKCGARMINRLHGPIPTNTLTSAATSEVAENLIATMRVRFDSDDDPEMVAKELKKASGVTDASAEYYRYTSVVPNDPDFGQLWGMQAINAPAAWDRTTGCTNVTVAVIDTGVDLNHPDLVANLVPGRDLVDLPGATPPPGFHFEGDNVGRDGVPQDEVGHGTHVAGTIGAVGNNNRGVAGVCWTVKMMPVKVLTRLVSNTNPADVRGTGSSADVAAGIRWAADNGADILNLSLGSTSSTFVERDAVAYAVAKGVLVVAAMGNHQGSQPNVPSFPAAYPNVLAVGAVNQAKQRASFSVRGPHIGVVGPGVDIWSTDWDDTYSSKSGTSMATPHVAGLAALMKCCKPSLTAVQIADIIRQTAEPLRDNPADPVPNDSYGTGLIDAEKAINRACPRIGPFPCVPNPCLRPPLPCIVKPPSPCIPRPCIPRPCIINPPNPCIIGPPRPCITPPRPCIPCTPCGPAPCRPCFGGLGVDETSYSDPGNGSDTGADPSANLTPAPCAPCVACLPPPPPPCGPCLPPPPPPCRPCLPPPPPPPCIPCRPCLPPPPPPCRPCLPPPPCRPCLPPPCVPCRPCLPPPPPPCVPCLPRPPAPCRPCVIGPSSTDAYAGYDVGYNDGHGSSGYEDWSGYDATANADYGAYDGYYDTSAYGGAGYDGYDWSGHAADGWGSADGSAYDWSAYYGDTNKGQS